MTVKIIPIADIRYASRVPHVPAQIQTPSGLLADTLGRPLRDLLQMISVRPTPFNPFVGPVVTSTNVRPTPFNPFIGPIVTQNSVALPNLLG